MRIVTDERVARFVGERVDRIIFPPWTAMGIQRRGRITAGAVFNCFTGPDIHVTVAGHGWTRGFLREVGEYAFGQLGCQRMTVITAQDAVADIAQRLGGKVEGTLRNQFGPGADGILIGVLKEEYRFRRHVSRPHSPMLPRDGGRTTKVNAI